MTSRANAIKSQAAQDDVPILVRTALIPQSGVWIVGDEDVAIPVATRLPNIITMEGNDMLYLQVDVTVGVPAAPIEMRVEFSHNADNTVAADWYPECALQPSVMAGGVISVDVAPLHYNFTVTGKYQISLMVDVKAVRVSFRCPLAATVGDLAAVTAIRRIRDSLVSP
jgi:hypothetical protein